MPGNKKPRKPKTGVKKTKSPKSDHSNEDWRIDQSQGKSGFNPGANVSAASHNRQPPKRGS